MFTDSGQRLDSLTDLWVELGDLDGDGDLDVFVARAARRGNRVLFNDGNGFFTDSLQSLGSMPSWYVTLGDLDGDGDLDAFVPSGGFDRAAPNEVWLNDGTGHFFDSGQQMGMAVSRYAGLGDLDGDDDLDAVVANEWGTANTVWINQLNPPLVALSLNQSTFVAGNTMNLTMDIAAGIHPVAADLWVRVLLPGGGYQYLKSNGGLGFRPVPYASNLTVSPFSGQVFSRALTGAEPLGSYQWEAVLTQPGSSNYLSPVDILPFSIAP